MSTLILPTAPIPPTRTDPRLLVIYGEPKIGKTTALSTLESTLIVDTHHGTEYLTALKVNINSLDELEQLKNMLVAKNKPYKRVAIDVINTVEDWCEFAARKQFKATTLGKNFSMGDNILDLPQGAGYKWLRNVFHQQLTVISQMADQIVLVSHIKDKYLDGGKTIEGTKLTDIVTSKGLDLTGKIANILCSVANAIGYMYREREKLMISFQTDATVSVGSHCKHLAGQKFEFDWAKIYIEGK